MFVSLYQAGLDTTGVTGPEADLLVERARAGFQAGRSERRAVYRKLGAVVDAALGLHEFLLANEDRIQYDPALGSSRDPVLEAVPDTPELGNDMWPLFSIGWMGSRPAWTRWERWTALRPSGFSLSSSHSWMPCGSAEP